MIRNDFKKEENNLNSSSVFDITGSKNEENTELIEKKVKFNPNIEFFDVESYKNFNTNEEKAERLIKNKKKNINSILDEDKICMIF
jgi:hypothetical protein